MKLFIALVSCVFLYLIYAFLFPACILRFSPRAFQASAKTKLAGIYEMETKYFSEFQTYTLKFPNTAWLEGTKKSPDYKVAVFTCTKGAAQKSSFEPTPWHVSLEARHEVDQYIANIDAQEQCKKSPSGFFAYAVGRIIENDPKVPLDVWRIDERKKLENLSIGI